MSLTRTLLLGFIAGVTILLGLPLGRLRHPAPRLRVFLNAAAVGVLMFLLWDVFSAAWEPVDGALSALHGKSGGLWPVAGYGLLFAGGTAVGLLGLVGYENWMRRRAAGGRRFGPGAMAAGELAGRRVGIAGWSQGRRLALLIAVGIGLHNFAEGLAIGQSAAAGKIAFATVLVIGFGLHNATEGFGVVAPLAADPDADRPSWAFLAVLGLIGGSPTLLGAAAGHGFTNEPVSVAFLTLAAGSIVYVILQLITVAAKAKSANLVAYGVLVGLLAGFGTDAVITAAGV